jgi:pyruvate/2-oxoglutarate dehydrogenase complex dihydrolipoamide dehydrogenase (E3) component
MSGNYDVIIIGSGAGGGTLAYTREVYRGDLVAISAMANALRVGDHLRQRMA